MMFRFFSFLLVILFLIPCTAALSADKKNFWRQCAPTAEEARKELAAQIQVEVQSSSHTLQSQKERESGIFFLSNWLSGSGYSSEKTFESRQKVHLSLVNVEIVQKEENEKGVCLQVQRKDLIHHANALLEKTRAYTPDKLPREEKIKKQTLRTWVEEIGTAVHFAGIFGGELKEKNPYDRLLRQEKELKDLSAKIFEQSVLFQTRISGATLILDGKTTKPGERIFLPEGRHLYRISAPGHCESGGDFVLETGKDQVIQVDPKPYPLITLTSNQPGAQVTLDGVPWPLDKAKTLERCEGEAGYVLTWAGEKKQGTLHLEPGLKAHEKISIYTDEEMDRLKAMAGVFTQGQTFEIGYLFSTAGSDFKDLHNIHKLSLAGYRNFRFLRLGLGAACGRSDATEESVTAEVHLSLLFQLSAIGGRERPLHLFGLFPLIPFAGVEVGAGYHDIHDGKKGKNIQEFPNPSSPDKEDWVRDHGLLRAVGGIQIPVNRHVGLKFMYGKNFYMEKASEFGASLALHF